jgi:hypothetical protein
MSTVIRNSTILPHSPLHAIGSRSSTAGAHRLEKAFSWPLPGREQHCIRNREAEGEGDSAIAAAGASAIGTAASCESADEPSRRSAILRSGSRRLTGLLPSNEDQH